MYNLPWVVQEARVAINEVELKLGFQHRAGVGSCRQTFPMVMQNRSFQRSTRSPEFVRVLWIGY